MGIFKAIGTSFSGALGDQWKEIITAPEFSEYQVLAPGYLKTNNGKSANFNGSEGVLTKGSIIYIPENTAMIVYSQSGIEEVVSTPGGYKYEQGEESIFSGGGLRSIFKNTISRVGFGGVSEIQKKVVFLNLREIKDIKFGTKGAQLYHDSFYDCDLEIYAYGSFTVKVVNAEKFMRNYVPANMYEYTFEEKNARSQLLSEFLQSFITALNSLSKNYKISEIASQVNELSKAIRGDENNADSWRERFGLQIVQVAIENVELSDESKELVKTYNQSKMGMRAYEGVSERASNMAAQQKIAEGIREKGMGDMGGMIFATNFAQNISPNAGKTETKIMSFDQQIEALKKLKDLVDAGILTEEEFEYKKKEIIGM